MTKMFCVYLTIYRGNKLPLFYLGHTSVENVENGYRGSVSSREYRTIWKEEIRNRPYLFETKILSQFPTKKQASEREIELLKKVKARNNPLYINRSDGAMGMCSGPLTKEHKKHLVEAFAKSEAKKKVQLENLKLATAKVKGKTYEEIYGPERAKQLKQIRSKHSRKMWKNPEIAKRITTPRGKSEKGTHAALRAWADPIVRAKRIEGMLRENKTPDAIRNRSEAQLKTWSDPIIRAKRIAGMKKKAA